MPYIPHTDDDRRLMLAAIGADSLEALFEEIPAGLRAATPQVPPGLNEMGITRLMRQRADGDGGLVNFIGAGAYEHHIPAAVWPIVTRGEFYTAYTPYQAEASQGTLQVLYEFQSMMAGLTAMDAANASLYDGGSALGEAILMALRCNTATASRKVLVPATVHPAYRRAARTLVQPQGVELVEIPFCTRGGHVVPAALARYDEEEYAALVIQQPNFFGTLEEVDALTAWAQQRQIPVVALVNPQSLGLLKPPGAWNGTGVDIVCGDGQPLGVPLSAGGPYFGFLCCKTAHLRQMPGRIAGATVDKNGKPGFVLTLQAREQHIRRARATSNICSNQGLLTVAAAIHMSLLGPEGLRRSALACHANTTRLRRLLTEIPGVTPIFDRPFYHEVALNLPRPALPVLEALSQQGMAAGFALGRDYPELGDTALLVCATEMRTEDEMMKFRDTLRAWLEA